MFTLYKRNYLYIVHYHSNFSVIKETKDLLTDRLILACKIIFFSEYCLPRRIMSETGSIFISDTFKWFCKSMNLEEAVLSLYNHQSKRQVEAWVKFIKHTTRKCIHTRLDIHIALLQIRSTMLGPGLPSPATLLFNHPIRDIMPVVNRPLINSILMMNIMKL